MCWKCSWCRLERIRWAITFLCQTCGSLFLFVYSGLLIIWSNFIWFSLHKIFNLVSHRATSTVYKAKKVHHSIFLVSFIRNSHTCFSLAFALSVISGSLGLTSSPAIKTWLLHLNCVLACKHSLYVVIIYRSGPSLSVFMKVQSSW